MKTKNNELEINEFEKYWSDVIEKIPVLHDKMIVDLVNGIEVNEDLIRVRETKQSLFERIVNGVSGKGEQSQQLIDNNFVQGLKSVKSWLEHLEYKDLKTNRAVILVANKLLETRQGFKKLSDNQKKYLQDFEDFLCNFNGTVEYMKKCYYELGEEVKRIGYRQNAIIAIENVFARWEAGYFEEYPPIIQLSIALEELYWSHFAAYDKFNNDLRKQVCDRCVSQLKKLTGYNTFSLIPTIEWFNHTAAWGEYCQKTINYLLSVDVFSNQWDCMPISISIISMEYFHKLSNLNKIPYVLSPKRISERLIKEAHIRCVEDQEGIIHDA